MRELFLFPEVHIVYCERYGKGEPSDEMFDILQADAVKKPFDRVIVIPTTCGTGSEVTVTAVFDRKKEGRRSRPSYPGSLCKVVLCR